MQQPRQELRPNIAAPLSRYGRQFRQKIKELSLSKLLRLLPTLPDRVKQSVGRQRGQDFYIPDFSEAVHYRESSPHGTDSKSTLSARLLSVHSSRLGLSSSHHSVVNIPISNAPVKSNISPEHSHFDKNTVAPVEILLRFPGDGPEQTHQAVASIDTQLVKVNLMRREVWDERLNEDRRGHLELDHNAYVSDFHVIEMPTFDVLIGSDTITQYQLVSLGPDLIYHFNNRPVPTNGN